MAGETSSKDSSFEAAMADAIQESKAVEDVLKSKNQLADDRANDQIREAKNTQQMGQLRALMLRELTRAKRLKKIKSKSFHRVQKKLASKEKEKVGKKDRRSLWGLNP